MLRTMVITFWLIVGITIGFSVVALVVAHADSDPAFAIKAATPSQKKAIYEAYNELPPCERDVIDKRLHIVAFVPQSKLKSKTRDLIWADSYGFGLTFVTQDIDGDILKRVFFHECGHYVDWYLHLADRTEFIDAIKADYAAMTPFMSYKNDYLMEPAEAAAEMFAFHFTERFYFNTPRCYDLQLMQRTHAVFEAELLHVCGD